VEQENLVQAFKMFGCTLPGRKALATTELDRIYKDVHKECLEQFGASTYYCVCTDGWRKKYAEWGVPLINVMALRGIPSDTAAARNALFLRVRLFMQQP
jgi:hypothetical protein